MKNDFKLDQYYFATGRRKTSTSRVYLKEGSGNFIINGKPLLEYFHGNLFSLEKVSKSLKVLDKEGLYDIKVNVKGGGFTGQIEATRLAIAKALLKIFPDSKILLRNSSVITSDGRRKERKMIGGHGSRAKRQFSRR